MSRESVMAFLATIAERQQKHAPDQVFRFRKVATTRRANSTLATASYPGDMDPAEEEAAAAAALQEKRRRAALGKAKRAAERAAAELLRPRNASGAADNEADKEHAVGRDSDERQVPRLNDMEPPPQTHARGGSGQLLQGVPDVMPMMYTFGPPQEVASAPLAWPTGNMFAVPNAPRNHPVTPIQLLTPGPGQEIGIATLDPVVAAATGAPRAESYQPVIDPALMNLRVQLPTPRQSVTPVPRPRPRPRGKAAHNVSSSAAAHSMQDAETPALAVPRKRTVNADALALEEAERLGQTSGKRQRKPAARKEGF